MQEGTPPRFPDIAVMRFPMRKRLLATGSIIGALMVATALYFYFMEESVPTPSIAELIEDSRISLERKKRSILDNELLNDKAKKKLIAYLEGNLKPKTPYDKPKEAIQFYRKEPIARISCRWKTILPLHHNLPPKEI